MLERRHLVKGSLIAGLVAAAATAEAQPPVPAVADDGASAAAINRFRETVERQFSEVYAAKWRGLMRVRQQQRTWLQSSRKYPDFLEIGLDVWDNVYDWHVAFQQPLNVTRLADGRYTMSYMFTTLLLRPDQSPDFVGYAFDADTPPRTR